ncbi:MAG: galactosyldiacylglycerol synthase [Chloroflexi bacterium]|nr:galactosyldiacylglycerol synthase [Chloroflexota bacterium]
MTPQACEKPPHIVFLFSDTGGGHRSAAQAIIEALDVEFPEQYTWEMVDFFRYYAPPPFNTAADAYAPMAQVPDLWEFGFLASNGKYRSSFIQRVLWPYVKGSVAKLIEDHPADLLLSVHPIINTPLLRGLGTNRPKYMTVITDMVSTHTWWYEKSVDVLIVPTYEAYRRGLELGVDPHKMHVVGLPIADKFTHLMSKQEAREALGLPQDLPLALLVSGGDGMGPLEETVKAIVDQKTRIGLVAVAGKNEALKARLESLEYPCPAFIKGFVTNMSDYMAASDVIITKAGPGTISEAFIAGLPIILYSKMPGQEDGNVDYVVNHEAGLWLPDPQDVAATLKRWMDNPAELEKYRQNSVSQARPDSSRIIARTAMGLLGKFPLETIKYYN